MKYQGNVLLSRYDLLKYPCNSHDFNVCKRGLSMKHLVNVDIPIQYIELSM